MKPGYKTTEFWVALVLMVAPIVLHALGVTGVNLDHDQVASFVTSLIAVVGSVVAGVTYIVSRYKLKGGSNG